MERQEMNNEEDYAFDVAGYLVLPQVLTPNEVELLNRILDETSSVQGMLGWEPPHREPFRDLLVNHTLVWYLNHLCGDGFRLERQPQLLVSAATPPIPLTGGDEPRDPARAYYYQNGRRLCQGIEVIWALDDVNSGDGGLTMIPCSHKSNVEIPTDVATGHDDMGLGQQIQLRSGDLLLCAATLSKGMRPWRNNKSRRLLHFTYASRGAIQHAGNALESCAEPQPRWRTDLDPATRAVLHKPGYLDTSPAPNIRSNGQQNLTSESYLHPSIFCRDAQSEIDEKEFYFWDLCGHLILPQVMSTDDLQLANEAIDRFADRIVVGEELARGSQALAGTGRPTMGGLLELPDPYCQPFRRMVAHPAIIQRLNWMGGSGFRCDNPTAFCAVKGTSGHTLHDANEPLVPSRSYVYKNGRSYCEAVTVSWQLRSVSADDGGFACVPGSHKASYRMPPGVRSCEDDLGLVTHPVMEAGDVLFFMDGAQTHGALPWHSTIPRRAILIKYSSRNFNRSGGNTVQPETRWGAVVEGMNETQLAVMRGPDRDAHGANVPRLTTQNGIVGVCYEKKAGSLYSAATPTDPKQES